MNNLTELAAQLNLGVKTVIVQTVDVSDVPLPPRLLGTLTPAVQQIMMAQRIRTVEQPSAAWSTDRGIGILGLNLLQIYMWSWWQKRGQSKSTELEQSTYGRPLVKKA